MANNLGLAVKPVTEIPEEEAVRVGKLKKGYTTLHFKMV